MFTRLKTNQITHQRAGFGAIARQMDVQLADEFNVKDFGATGDGTTDDSSAIQACIVAAKVAGRGVYFPDGNYNIATLGTQSGRLFLYGNGRATLKGTLLYHDETFPTSADTLTPLTPTAPFFSAVGINFQSATSDFALKLTTIEQSSFLSTFSLTGCKFYGNKGVMARYMIGFELTHCEFNNVVAGARFESCTNGMMVACRWQNQAESGVWILSATGSAFRKGGENLKFVLCEWAVCTYGMIVDQHMWLSMESCLMDYCALPLALSGSNWAKASQSYFGAANVPVAKFSGVSGFLAVGIAGVAVYGRPGGDPVGSRVTGFTAHNCEFIKYDTGTNTPLVSIDGYYNGTYPQSAEEVSFFDCLFYAVQAHSAATMLYINAARGVRVIGNRFRSFNLGSSMTDAYRTTNCSAPMNHSNDFWNCRQSGVQVGSSFERPISGAYVQAGDPGAVGAGSFWVVP